MCQCTYAYAQMNTYIWNTVSFIYSYKNSVINFYSDSFHMRFIVIIWYSFHLMHMNDHVVPVTVDVKKRISDVLKMDFHPANLRFLFCFAIIYFYLFFIFIDFLILFRLLASPNGNVWRIYCVTPLHVSISSKHHHHHYHY